MVRLAGREPKDNPRFVVTNLRRVAQRVYEAVYCQRAHIENRIKELHYGLAIDRTSCTSFWANQLRVLLTAAAYVLMQELRLRAKRTGCASAQVTTLRERLFKLGAWLERSVRRIVVHLPDNAPWRSEWCRVARAWERHRVEHHRNAHSFELAQSSWPWTCSPRAHQSHSDCRRYPRSAGAIDSTPRRNHSIDQERVLKMAQITSIRQIHE